MKLKLLIGTSKLYSTITVGVLTINALFDKYIRRIIVRLSTGT